MGLTRTADLTGLPLFATAGTVPAPAVDWRAVRPAEVVCPACGARDYAGRRTGFWQIGPDGLLYHWCAGYPGRWTPARLDGNGKG